MGERFEMPSVSIATEDRPYGIVLSSREANSSRIHAEPRACDPRVTCDGDHITFGSPFPANDNEAAPYARRDRRQERGLRTDNGDGGQSNEGQREYTSGEAEEKPSASDLRNSMTHVEGERVYKDKYGNTVVDRSHCKDLHESHPVKEIHGKHGIVYKYKDGREVHVSRDGFVAIPEFDAKSGTVVHRIVGTRKHVFNPLLS